MAVEFISSGIISSGLNITDNQIIILTGGSGDSLTVAGPSGELTVSSGGKATSTFINEGGKLIVEKDGTATVVNLSSGGFLNTSAGEITDITIAAGATVNGFLINNDITTTSIIDGAFKVSGASVQNTSAHIYSGGTATSTTVKNAGYLLVSSGGTALDTIVDSAFMGISSGGTAASTAVINEGLLLVLNGGMALNTTVDNAFMNIYSGGEANQVTLKGNAFLNVFEYATVLNLSAGAGSIINGFTLSNKIENQDIINGAFKVSSASVQNSFAHIYSGGTATSTSVISGGHLLVSNGGIALNTTIDNASMNIGSGGTAASTSVISGGNLLVSNGGKASETTVDNASMNIGSAGSAFYTTLNTSGHLTVRGFAQDTLVNSSATISVKSNGRANLLNILQGGKLETDETANVNNIAVDAGGLINGFTINNRIENTNIVHGAFKVSSASVKDSDAWIYNGGSALSTTIERGKALQLHSGGTALDTAIISGSMIVNNAGSATRTTVYTKGFITISSSGTVTDTTVFGSANLNSGGFAKNTTVTGSAVFNIHGSAVNTLLSDGAKAVVNKDASARYATISSGGTMTVLEQGNAANVSICFGGELVVSAGASASYVYNPWGGTLTPSEGAYVSALTKYGIYLGNQTSGIIETAQYKNSHTVTSGLSMIVISNGTAASTKVEEDAVMLVSSGGRATGTTVDSNGSMTVNSSARISATTVEEAGSLVISNGGLAYDTELKSGAKMTISSGGSGCMTAISKGATLHVSSGGYAQIVFNPWGGEYTSESGAIVDEQKTHCIYVGNETSGVTERFDSSNDYKICSGLSMMIYEHGTATGTTIEENAKMVIFDQGFAANTIVESEGAMNIAKGGIAANANLKNGAVLSIENGGTAVNLQTESGANLTVSAGGMLTGYITLSDKTDITMLEGSIICFNLGYQQGVTEKELAGKARQKYALLNNYEFVSSGAQSYKLILKNDMKAGEIYVLADNTAGFSKTIEILDRSLKLNETIRHGKRFYQLCNDEYVFSDTNQENSSLTLKVYNEVKGDIDGNGISDVLFQYNGDDQYKGQLGFWMNGTNEWQSDGVAQPTEWEVIGVRDMNADGKADIVMCANTDVNGIKGAYIGYYVNGDTGKWQNIGYLAIEEDDKWEAKVGNVTGTGGKSSIIWHCAEKHAIGVWKDGTDEWVQIGHYFEDDVKFIGTADFNGDNKDEILLQKGGLFYTVDIDSTDIKPKCNTLGELYGGWEVAAVGDFAGDGKDDLILYYEALGLVIHCNDGFISNWKQLGQLDHKHWKITGSGDYNGDGKDDLLVRQQSTGLLGYYDGGDMTKWKEMGNGVNQNWALFSEI